MTDWWRGCLFGICVTAIASFVLDASGLNAAAKKLGEQHGKLIAEWILR